MRAKVRGWTSADPPRGSVSVGGGSPSTIPRAVPPSIARKLDVVEAGEARRADRHEQRVRLSPIRVVGRVHDLFRRHLSEEIEEIEGAPDRGVEVHAGDPSQATGERGHVRDPRVRDDQSDSLVATHELLQVLCDRRETPASVDEDRNASLDRELEHRAEPLVVEREGLCPWVELDSARASVERAPRFVDRAGGQVEAHERDEPALRALPVGERAIVGNAKTRFSIRLVETEDEGTPEPEAVEERRELLVATAHPVDVVAEVRVGVEEVRIGREL